MTFDELIVSYGFNPKNFAKAAGLERESVRQYRHGICMPNLNAAAKIAKTLGCSMEQVHSCWSNQEESNGQKSRE